ncbi:MAG: glutamate--tRNA ligase [Candidatus Margulisbacteria bacterium]|nr:glutamate--tRNA ligase [Candidatus Margulisiibacteriota bacterium]
MNKQVRVRFAPSPTGNLHIGSARTALFNFLFAKYKKGKFILRIEDTDLQRSKKEYEEDILAGLKWLGIEWDEGPLVGGDYGPYYQKERWQQGIYKKYADELVREGKAYYCFCEQQKEQDKDDNEEQHQVMKYSGHCRNLSEQEVITKLAQHKPYVVRFKVPEEVLTFHDLVRGDISFDMALQGDMVILRSGGMPTYNFAVVIDDLEMQITHIVRGEDHISNTPKQIQLYQALGHKEPEYAHLSIILGPDRAKLSKRHGAKSVSEFKNEGFLAEAVFNFLSVLGWSHPSDKEILSREELYSGYTLERVSKSNSIFNLEKLIWMNGQYIRALANDRLFAELKPFIKYKIDKYNNEQWLSIVDSVKEKLSLLTDINEQIAVYFEENISYQNEQHDVGVLEILSDYMDLLAKSSFTIEELTQITNDFVKERKISKGQLFHGLRYAVTAQPKGPALFKLLHVLGKDITCKRIKEFLSYAQSNSRT